tara:strand:+ start:54 stop:515 length:462 start_codon:yes stop_codon:yes gene_type:complete
MSINAIDVEHYEFNKQRMENRFNLKVQSDVKNFNIQADLHLLQGNLVELKKVKEKRTDQQNRSLHLFFTIISRELNELGLEYIYFGLKGTEIHLMYTPELVKNFFWKPIQIALFDFESTTKLTTEQINKISDVIIKFFAEKEVLIEFPCLENK